MELHLNDELKAFGSQIYTRIVLGEQTEANSLNVPFHLLVGWNQFVDQVEYRIVNEILPFCLLFR